MRIAVAGLGNSRRHDNLAAHQRTDDPAEVDGETFMASAQNDLAFAGSRRSSRDCAAYIVLSRRRLQSNMSLQLTLQSSLYAHGSAPNLEECSSGSIAHLSAVARRVGSLVAKYRSGGGEDGQEHAACLVATVSEGRT